jgi:hemerythrin
MLKSFKLNKKINELHKIVFNKINALNLNSNQISVDICTQKITELVTIADKYFEFDDNLVEYIDEINPELEMASQKNYFKNKLAIIKEEHKDQVNWIGSLKEEHKRSHDADEKFAEEKKMKRDNDMEDEYQKLANLRKEYVEYKALYNIDSNDYSDILVDSVYSFINGLTPKEAWDIESTMSLSSSVPYLQGNDYGISFYHYPKKYVEKYKLKYQDYSLSQSRRNYFRSRILGYIPEGVEKFYKGIRAIKSSYELAEIDGFKEINRELET